MNALVKSFFSLAVLAALISCGNGGSGTGNTAAENVNPRADEVVLDVYKSESCGCCGIWVDYMEAEGYTMRVHHPDDLNAVKAQHGIEPQWQSCHTAVTKDGYVFEGHIPARFVDQFLESPPQAARGLAVAGMPLGSPGMEVEDRFTPYEVVLLKRDGSTEVYAQVNSAAEQF